MDAKIFIGKKLIVKYKIKNGSNFPLYLSNAHFNIHLGKISDLAGFDFNLMKKGKKNIYLHSVL